MQDTLRYGADDLRRFAETLFARAVALQPAIVTAIAPWASELGVALPAAVDPR
jgi:hypothetical protein